MPKKTVQEGNVSRKLYVISLAITVIVTALIAPYFSALFANLQNPKPDIYINRENCAITPLWGTELVAFKVVITNKGSVQEDAIVIRVELSEPFHHKDTNLTTLDRNIGSIRSGESKMSSVPITAPSVDYIQHCSITI